MDTAQGSDARPDAEQASDACTMSEIKEEKQHILDRIEQLKSADAAQQASGSALAEMRTSLNAVKDRLRVSCGSSAKCALRQSMGGNECCKLQAFCYRIFNLPDDSAKAAQQGGCMLLPYERGNRNNSFDSPFLQDNQDAFEELEHRVCSKTVAAKALAGQTRLNITMQELAVRRRSL